VGHDEGSGDQLCVENIRLDSVWWINPEGTRIYLMTNGRVKNRVARHLTGAHFSEFVGSEARTSYGTLIIRREKKQRERRGKKRQEVQKGIITHGQQS
jgi:hypothetical protein